MQDLELANIKYVDLLSETAAVVKDIEVEMEAHDTYKEKFLEAKLKFIGQLNVHTQQETNTVQASVHQSEKPSKRLFLEVAKYSGGVSTWLQFWSHFRKIHEDKSVSKEDKTRVFETDDGRRIKS